MPYGIPSVFDMERCARKTSAESMDVSKQVKQSNSRSSPPLCPGGCGSKQLSKALEINAEESTNSSSVRWIIYTGKNPCFAKFLHFTENKYALVQPLCPSIIDPEILQLWV